MHIRRLLLLFLLVFSFFSLLKAQTLDTLVDVGGYRLHFHVTKGNGTPILFENGSGADYSMWDTIIKPLSEITHAPLITYDRAGFGKSEVDPLNTGIDGHGIESGVKGLRAGLTKLGYDRNIVLVASSFGGFYLHLFAAQTPEKVKAIVGVDMNHIGWFTDSFINAEMSERRRDAEIIKKRGFGLYYQQLNLENIVKLLRKTPFPATIPAIDLVSEFNIPDAALSARWRQSHERFAAAASNRESIFAKSCGHVIFRDNPLLVIGAIVKAYVKTANMGDAAAINKRYLSYSLPAAIDTRAAEIANRYSENNLMAWGNAMLHENKYDQAIGIFKLNVTVNPKSANGYASLGTAYELKGDKAEAISQYKHSLEIDPGNKNISEQIKKLQQ